MGMTDIAETVFRGQYHMWKEKIKTASLLTMSILESEFLSKLQNNLYIIKSDLLWQSIQYYNYDRSNLSFFGSYLVDSSE